MFRNFVGAAAVALALVVLPAPAWAQNDQTVVIGYGAGGYSAVSDDVRGTRAMFSSHLYAEWYALGQLGFGLRRSVGIDVGFALLAIGAFEVFSMTTDMVTVNWVPLGAQSYARLGVVGGIGQTEYEYDGEIFLLPGAKRKVSTSGSATLLGVYLDWGADGFGARLGYDTVSTQLKDVEVAGKTLKVDGSGTSVYLDLRWAF